MSKRAEKLRYKEMTDEQLVEATCEGRTIAFDELIYRHSRKIYRLIHSLVRKEQDAYDIAQDAYIKAFQSIKTLKERDKFQSWVFRITRNAVTDYFRKLGKDPLGASITINEEPNKEEGDAPSGVQIEDTGTVEPGREIDGAYIIRKIWEAILELPEIYQMPVARCLLLSEDPEEVAKDMNIPHATLRTRLFYARKALCVKLASLKKEVIG